MKRNAVVSAKVKKNALTGADVKEATFGEVPSAAKLAGIPEAAYLRSDQCRPGSVQGWARIEASASFSATYQPVPVAHNCAQGPVLARRMDAGPAWTGLYLIRFSNNPGRFALATSDTGSSGCCKSASIYYGNDPVDGQPAIRVVVTDNGGSGAANPTDTPFTIAVF